ncbi:MAG TPA: hypothetical protein PLO67_21460 [Saprospiraceae bacterium]|nr:hypothetical protein [Saprospiraceae bacterium]HPI08560.1 hypothetical protein [Saprospiraceae bacterium]
MEKYLLDMEAYLDGSMTDTERRDFEGKLQTSPQLQEELREMRALRTDLAYHYAAKDVAEAAKVRAAYERKKRVRKGLLLCLLAGMLASLYFFWPTPKQTTPSEATENEPVIAPSSQNPVAPEERNQDKKSDKAPEIEQPVPAVPQKSRPIAGDLKRTGDSSGDLYRDLPAEPVSAVYRQFFETRMQSFAPSVRPQGIWKQAVLELERHRPSRAHRLLKNLPATYANSDTTRYLLAVSELQMQRPAAAEDLLYPLIAEKKWQTEGQYLLIWAYLLEGNTDLAKSSLQLLPDAYRDKKAIADFLNK